MGVKAVKLVTIVTFVKVVTRKTVEQYKVTISIWANILRHTYMSVPLSSHFPRI